MPVTTPGSGEHSVPFVECNGEGVILLDEPAEGAQLGEVAREKPAPQGSEEDVEKKD